MFNISSLKQTIGGLKSTINNAQSDLEKLRQRREELLLQPPTKAEVIQVLHARIDALASEYPTSLQNSLKPFLNNTLSDLEHQPLGFLIPATANYIGAGNSTSVLFERFAFFLQKPFKDGIAAAIEQMDWPKNAISNEEREKEIATLNQKIGKLEQELSELKSEAANAGIFID
jgi:predicted  nucleic acid-binding Zn-ribbon protein